jgi:hypothetical protein
MPIPERDPRARPATLAMKVVYATGIGAVFVFVIYFLIAGLS